MRSMCCNCAYFEPVEPPYCTFHMCFTDPETECGMWQTNQKPTQGKEEA